MPERAVHVKGGSVTIEFESDNFRENETCASKKIFTNPNARITRVEVVGCDHVVIWYDDPSIGIKAE